MRSDSDKSRSGGVVTTRTKGVQRLVHPKTQSLPESGDRLSHRNCELKAAAGQT